MAYNSFGPARKLIVLVLLYRQIPADHEILTLTVALCIDTGSRVLLQSPNDR